METKEIFIIGLLLVSALVFAAGESVEKWQVQDYWGRLEARMTEQVIVELLGEPLEMETRTGMQVWYYQQAPQREGDRIIDRPRHGLLMFKQSNGQALLYKWEPPNWTIVTPHSEAQYLKEQTRLETEAKREQSRLKRDEAIAERNALREQQKVKTEQLKAEREAARQKAIEENRQQREEQAALRQRKVAERQAQNPTGTKQEPFELTSYQFMFSAAAVFLIMAIGISFLGYFKKG